MQKIKVLIVDDSFFMRNSLKKILTTNEIEVIDTASNGKEGYEKAIKLQPDVITMDIEMPIMNGIDSLKKIMETFPTPVIMVSTLTSEGAEVTLEALSLGAIDFVTKTSGFKELGGIRNELISKVKAIGFNAFLQKQMMRKRLLLQKRQKTLTTPRTAIIKDKHGKTESDTDVAIYKKRPKKSDLLIIGIGISTGGPTALQQLMKRLPGEIPVPIVIVQHMPPFFTKSLAKRLDSMSQLTVKEAEDGEILKRSYVYIAPGGFQMTVDKKMIVHISEEPKNAPYTPCVDVMMNSLIESFGRRVMGIIMTGMGHDGLESLKILHNINGYIITQDTETAVIAGMPKSIIDAGIADEVHPLNNLAHAIATIFQKRALSVD